ncbi:hypothetical protein [Microtetraspora niveoalba]|uniref:hypothetical protein n=1 Tax=Microtetraspora niveoalba TaxID=46175 RepID=UPI0012FB774F|nr:hypothetical protein [Microtetraspora niveoalba]
MTTASQACSNVCPPISGGSRLAPFASGGRVPPGPHDRPHHVGDRTTTVPAGAPIGVEASA